MKILHISDAHFGLIKSSDGKLEKSSHYFIELNTKRPDPKVLLELVTSYYSPKSIDLIIDSGDVGWSGSSKDYDFAYPFYKGLEEHFKNAELVIIPGNHDVLLIEEDFSLKQNHFVNFLKKLYKKRFKNLFPFFDKKDRHTLIYYKYFKGKALVLGFNSAASINDSTDEKNSTIFITPSILNLISQKIAKDNIPTNILRIAVMHHHLLPFVEPKWDNVVSVDSVKEKVDKSLILNSARVQSWLGENHFHIVLHGHKHIFHGREDLLWNKRLDKNQQRKLLILGVGSIGAKDDSRRPSPLSFNEIKVLKTYMNEFRINVSVKSINEKSANFTIEDWISKNHSTSTKSAVNHFESENIIDCYEQLKYEIPRDEKVFNFISIVSDSIFKLPENCKIGEVEVTIDLIKSSFFTLHPEFDNKYLKNGWKNAKAIRKSLSNRSKNYSIDHGSRMFGANDLVNLVEVENKRIEEYFPVFKAIQNINYSSTRGYVGLYNYDLDVKRESSALPGLTGIQFIPKIVSNRHQLDIIAFFRNIELSFWWLVNMYEMEKLLQYACRKLKNKYRPGTITFFSSIAEWQTEHSKVAIKPIFELLTKEEIYSLVSKLELMEEDAFISFKSLLEDYDSKLSDININYLMLDEFNSMVNGIDKKTPIIKIISRKINEICTFLEESIEDKVNRYEKVDEAKELLSELINILGEFQTNLQILSTSM